MEAIFKLFNIPTDEITEVARNTESIIAGSAPLCALVGGKWDPSDLDIWYYDACDLTDASYDKLKNVFKLYTELLTKYGYKLYEKEEPSYMYTTTSSSFGKSVKRVNRFYNGEIQKSVQLIITREPVTTVVKAFDLSCCATWWDPRSSDDSTKMIQTYDSNTTLAGIMYSMSDSMTEREKERINKYKIRGFTLGKPY